jgi:hypothetical protein
MKQTGPRPAIPKEVVHRTRKGEPVEVNGDVIDFLQRANWARGDGPAELGAVVVAMLRDAARR